MGAGKVSPGDAEKEEEDEEEEEEEEEELEEKEAFVEEKSAQELAQDQMVAEKKAEAATAEKKIMDAVRHRAFVAKWVPILVVGPYAWLLVCTFNVFWGPIASEALFMCSELTDCYEKLEDTIASTSGGGVSDTVCDNPREFIRYHTWTGFLYLLGYMLLFFGPVCGCCACCKVQSVNTLVVVNLLFLVIFGIGLAVGLAWSADAADCEEKKQKHVLYYTYQLFVFQLEVLFLALLGYAIKMAWSCRVEHQRKQKIIGMMQNKVSFGFDQMAKLKQDERDDDAQEAAVAEGKRKEAEQKAKEATAAAVAKVEAEAAAAAEAQKRREEFFGDDSGEEGEAK